jgi:UDP-glucose:(heptosyl)LPS alpha-1,3-glucosyltransferase
VREEILQHFAIDPAKLHLIRNGVDIQRFMPASTEQRLEARTNLGLPPNRNVFAFVGSGFERKGLANAIRALADPAAPKDALLVVVGDDRKARWYRRLADTLQVGERVVFAGSLVDVRPILHAADGFVLPTIYDPFPNAVLEALACGLPVITSKKCGAGELIQAGQNGFVGDADDPSAIAHQMTAILANPQMRSAARLSALPYTLKNLAGELLALYRTLNASTGY